MSLSSVRSETALRSRLFSSPRSFRRFTCSVFSPPNSWRPIIRHLTHADLADCVHYVLALREQNIDLAATSRRSLQACIASLPLQSSLMSRTYLKSDHFNGGGSGLHRTIGRAGGRLSETRSPGRGHRQSDLARRKGARRCWRTGPTRASARHQIRDDSRGHWRG